MKILHRYVFSTAMRYFFLVLVACTVVFVTADFFEKVDDLIEVKVKADIAVRYFLYRLPFMVVHVWAPSAFMGCLILMMVFHSRRESIAIKAAGIGLRAYFVPIFYFALLGASIFFVFRETLEKPLFAKSEEIWAKRVHQSGRSIGRSGQSIWYVTGDKIIRSAFYDPLRRAFYRVSIFSVGEDFTLKELFMAEFMVWDGKKWILHNAVVYDFGGKRLSVRTMSICETGLSDSPDDLITFRSLPDVLQFWQLFRIIRLMKAEGVGTETYELEFFRRITDALWVFTASLLGIIIGNHPKLAPHVVRILAGGILCYGAFFGLYQAGLAVSTAGIVPACLSIPSPFVVMLFFILRWIRSFNPKTRHYSSPS